MSKQNSIILFKTIFDFFPDAIVIVKKKDFKIVNSNIEFQNLFKISNESLVGRNLKDILSERKIFFFNFEDVNKDEGVLIINENIEIFDNNFVIKCVFSREFNDNFFMIFTSLEKLNEENELSLDYLSEIFNILSHEINNPISSISLAADLIKRKYKNVDDELIQIIKSESSRISRLFGNFNYSPLQNMLNKNDENIHELIRFSLFKIKQLPNPIKIIEEFDPSLPLIKINRDIMLQALDNIFVNAYESSDYNSNSYLKIQTRFVIGESIKIPNIKNFKKRNCISIVVSNNGAEISEETLKKVFLPFFSTKKRGSGVGLFIVKKIINDHDGTINIKSENGVVSVKIILPF